MTGRSTLDFYASEAADYASHYTISEELAPFLARLPSGARVLELGCGGGHDARAMLDGGFDVLPTDGSPQLAREAEKRIGRPVRVLLFEDLEFDREFDGVWASACLLHVPRPALAGVLSKVHASLRQGGVFHASFKTGGEEGLDRFGRYYNQPDEGMLREALGKGRWRSMEMSVKAGSGYYNLPSDWLNVTAVKA